MGKKRISNFEVQTNQMQKLITIVCIIQLYLAKPIYSQESNGDSHIHKRESTRGSFLDMITGKKADGSQYKTGTFSRSMFRNTVDALTPSRALLDDGVSMVTGRHADGKVYKEGDLIANAADRSIDSVFGKVWCCCDVAWN